MNRAGGDADTRPRDRDLPSLGAAALAVDPHGLGGACLRGPPGPIRDRWIDHFRTLRGGKGPLPRLPPGATLDRVVGGLDLPATLAAGRRVIRRGVLARAHGTVLIVPSAERLPVDLEGPLLGALDRGEVRTEREGVSDRRPARLGVILLDESREDELPASPALLDRVAFLLHLPRRWKPSPELCPSRVARARGRLDDVQVPGEAAAEVCARAAGRGIASLRPPILALRAARIFAALDRSEAIGVEHLEAAVGLVLDPRGAAASGPPPEAEGEDEIGEGGEEGSASRADRGPDLGEDPVAGDDEEEGRAEGGRRLPDRTPGPTQARLPEGLKLPEGSLPSASRGGVRGRGRRSAASSRGTSGRSVGTRPGDPRRDGRLDPLATLRAAAPLQALRGGELTPGTRIRIRPEDLRVRIRMRPEETTTVFAVDASGSQALRRLGEVKGAVELILAQSYLKREEVALVAFRDRKAQLLLPPTRSLTRARRVLAGMPGGGATPLALGLEATLELSERLQRDGRAPLLVVLTDGRPNVDRQGRPGRAAAREDALAVARAIRRRGLSCLVLDTSARGQEFVRKLAEAMDARYAWLPYADARKIGRLVRGAHPSPG